MIVLRALVGVVAFLLLLLLALLGLGAALGAIDPAGAARVVGLPAVRDAVGAWLDGLEGSGPDDTVSALSAAGAVLLGLALLAGALVPRRERLVRLRATDLGTLAARRRALGTVAQALAEQTNGVTEARVKVRPRRRRGGRLRVRATRPRPADDRAVRGEIKERLRPLTGPFALKASVRTRVGDRGARVQ